MQSLTMLVSFVSFSETLRIEAGCISETFDLYLQVHTAVRR
jgi:hypothetical protein